MADATAVDAESTVAEAEDAVGRLERLATELERAEAAVEAEGEAALRAVAEAHDELLALVDEADGSATGSGREAFKAYVAFQEDLVSTVERLPDDLLEREAFEAVVDELDKRRLSPADMERARETLEPAAERADLLDRRAEARRRYRRARNAVEGRRREVEAAIEEREALLAFDDVDLDADVGPLREAVAAYDDAVREAFRSHLASSSAREVLAALEAAAAYPLVDLAPPPGALATYVRRHDVGEEPVHRLVELADYSASKLSHYVDDPATFRERVGGHRRYLEGLDAEPLTVGWPPPEAGRLRFLARELVPVVDRLDGEAAVARLHELRDRTREPAYERRRATAVARERLDDVARERLASGAVEAELEALRATRDRLEAALDEHPER